MCLNPINYGTISVLERESFLTIITCIINKINRISIDNKKKSALCKATLSKYHKANIEPIVSYRNKRLRSRCLGFDHTKTCHKQRQHLHQQ